MCIIIAYSDRFKHSPIYMSGRLYTKKQTDTWEFVDAEIIFPFEIQKAKYS